MRSYDVVIIGAGLAGQRAALTGGGTVIDYAGIYA